MLKWLVTGVAITNQIRTTGGVQHVQPSKIGDSTNLFEGALNSFFLRLPVKILFRNYVTFTILSVTSSHSRRVKYANWCKLGKPNHKLSH